MYFVYSYSDTLTEIEFNGSFTTADKLFSTYMEGKISNIFDVDYYKTKFNKEDVVIILDHIPQNKDYDIYVYDHNKTLLGSSKGKTVVDSISLQHVNIDQWYYIKVKGYKMSFDSKNNYRLLISQLENKDIAGSTFEMAKVATTLKPSEG